MEAENVLNLFDSYWYDLDFFKRSKPEKINEIPEIPSSNMNDLEHNISNLPTIHTKFPSLEKMSLNSNLHEFSASPNSVLQSPKLQTIFSGKEAEQFDNSKLENSAEEQESKTSKTNSLCSTPSNMGILSRRKKKKKGLSKSLSDLEFEELKGFMDLGFVFSEKDKDSTLASIIPGLQRLGNNTNTNTNTNTNNNTNNNNNVVDMSSNNNIVCNKVSRPYLSEAWEVLEKRKKKNKENSMLNWKVPASTNQIDMKDYLKSWAHNVASTVKL